MRSIARLLDRLSDLGAGPEDSDDERLRHGTLIFASMVITLISQIVVPLGLCSLFQASNGLEPHEVWTAILLGHCTRCVLTVLRFRQGKWRHIKVE